jgi:hypothetical protein
MENNSKITEELIRFHLNKFHHYLIQISEYYPNGKHPISQVLLKEYEERFERYLR